jgi:hypothetical protein
VNYLVLRAELVLGNESNFSLESMEYLRAHVFVDTECKSRLITTKVFQRYAEKMRFYHFAANFIFSLEPGAVQEDVKQYGLLILLLCFLSSVPSEEQPRFVTLTQNLDWKLTGPNIESLIELDTEGVLLSLD